MTDVREVCLDLAVRFRLFFQGVLMPAVLLASLVAVAGFWLVSVWLNAMPAMLTTFLIVTTLVVAPFIIRFRVKRARAGRAAAANILAANFEAKALLRKRFPPMGSLEEIIEAVDEYIRLDDKHVVPSTDEERITPFYESIVIHLTLKSSQLEDVTSRGKALEAVVELSIQWSVPIMEHQLEAAEWAKRGNAALEWLTGKKPINESVNTLPE
jgi:hypothetical protein